MFSETVFLQTTIEINKIDTSLFVQKLYLRTEYIESNIDEDIDLKIHIRIKNYLILLALETLVVKILLIIYSMILA